MRVPRLWSVPVAVISAASVLSACAGAARSSGGTPKPPPFDPAAFVDPTTSTNPYHPLRPGMQWVRGGTTEVGSRKVPYQVISTMTDVIRVIHGVKTVAMLDQSTDAGQVAEVGMDYMALDKDGNVWILAGYTESYEGGQYTNTADAWVMDTGGAKAGVLMPGAVTAKTPRWFIGSHGQEVSVAEPVKVGASVCVAFGCYQDVRVIREGEAGAIDNEHKYYAPGVGVVKNEPKNKSLHQDTFELQNFTELSADGLTERSNVVLELERHALTTAPQVFGTLPLGMRKA